MRALGGVRRLVAALLLFGGAVAFAILATIPPWIRAPICLGLAAGYAVCGVGVAFGVWFARPLAIGLGWFGVMLVVLKQVRLFGLAPYFAGGHAALALALSGDSVAAVFPRLRFGLSEHTLAKVEPILTAAATLVPFLFWNGLL